MIFLLAALQIISIARNVAIANRLRVSGSAMLCPRVEIVTTAAQLCENSHSRTYDLREVNDLS